MAVEVAEYLQRTPVEDLPSEVLTAFRPHRTPGLDTAREIRALRHELAASDGTHDAGLGDALAPLLAHALHVRLEVTDQHGTTRHGPDSETVVKIADEGTEHRGAEGDDTEMLSERESSPAQTDHGDDLTMLVDPAETELAQVTAAREVRAPADAFRRSVSASFLRGYEVRRGYLENGDAATEIVVRIHIRREPAEAGIEEGYGYDAPVERFTDAQIGAVIDRAWDGVNAAYNTGHRLPDGSVLRVRPEFVDHSADVNHHVHIVDLFSTRLHENNETWSLESTPDTLAHEIGHLLGLDDEYRRYQNRHTVYTDGTIMSSDRVEHGRISADQLAGIGGRQIDGVPTLAPRGLRELGSAIDEVFGTRHSRLAPHLAPDGRPLPPRASFGEDVRQASLYGDRRTGIGHLLPPAGSDRRRPSGIVEQHANGVLHVEYEAARPGRGRRAVGVDTESAAGDLLTTDTAQRRRLFPRNWTEDDAVYAAEQAYLDALRGNAVAPAGGGRHRWTGEYAGVRIEGEVHGGTFLSFRPADTQPEPHESAAPPPPTRPRRSTAAWDGLSDLGPLPPRDPALDYAPSRPESVLRYGQRAQDVSRYGDRQFFTGLHQEFVPRSDLDLATWHRLRGVEVIDRGPIHVNGTYQARVRFLDARVAPDAPLSQFRNRWFEPRDGSVRTMFPRDWGRVGVLQAVETAHAGAFHRVRIDDRTYRWIGEANGVRIEGLSRNGRHLAYRPTELQPGGATEGWDQHQLIAGGAPRAVAVGTGQLQVRRVLFNSGQQGLDIVVPLHVGRQAGVTEQQIRAYTDQVNRDVALTWAQGNQGRQPLLVNVTVVPVARPEGAFRSLTPQEAAGSTPSTLLGPLLPAFGWNRQGGPLRQLFDLAGPVTVYSPRVLPTEGPAALREPGPRRPDEQPAAVDPQFDVGTLRPDFAEAAWRDPRGPGLPREWSADDIRYAAGVVLDQARRTGPLPLDGVLDGTVGGVTVHLRREGGRITEVWGEPGQEGSRQHSTPAANGAPVARNAVRPDDEPAGASMLRALVEDDPQVLRRLFDDEAEAERLAADPAEAEKALRALVESRFLETPELAREAHELYTAWARWMGNEPADWPDFVGALQREIAAWREQGWDGVSDPASVRDAFAVLTAAALDLRVSLVQVREGHAELALFGPTDGRPVRLDHDEREGYSTVEAATRRQELERAQREAREERRRVEEEESKSTTDDEEEVLVRRRRVRQDADSERRTAEKSAVEGKRKADGEDEDVTRPKEEDSDEESGEVRKTPEELEEERRRAVEGKRKADGEDEDVTRLKDEDEDSDEESGEVRKTPEELEEERRHAEERRKAVEGKRKAEDEDEDVIRPKEEDSDEDSDGERMTPQQLEEERLRREAVREGKRVAPGPQVPQSVLDRGVLSGAHMVSSLGKADTELVRELGRRIEAEIPADTPNRESFARALAESVFSGTNLRALVSALSRGDVLHIPVGTDAHQGTITLRGDVAGLVHHTQKAKYEYEGGGDRVVTLGESKASNRSGGIGIQGRGDFFKIMRATLDAFGLNRDKTRADELTTSSKFFSRAKTTELTEVFRGNLLIEVGYRPKGERETTTAAVPRLDPADPNVLRTPIEVGVPERETRAALAKDIEDNRQGAIDDSLLRQPRLHSSAIMLDVHVKGDPHVRSSARGDHDTVRMENLGRPENDVLPVRRQAMAGVVDALRRSVAEEKEAHRRTVRERTTEDDAGLDADALRERAARDEAAAARIARAEEALDFHGRALSDRLVAEFGFGRLQQDFKGLTNGESVIVRVPGSDVWAEVKAANRGMRVVATTKDTEFNTGAGTVMTRLRRKVVTGFLQLQGGGRMGTDEVNAGASFGKRWGKDKIVVSGRTLETAVTTKTKENGAVLDGEGHLEVVIHRGKEKLGDTVEVPVGFRSLMPQSDLRQYAPAAPVESGPHRLPESTVVRDIGSLDEIRTRMEEAGQKQFGGLWPQIRAEVMQVVTQPSLAAKLSAMSRGDEFVLTAFDRDKVVAAFAALAEHGIKVTVKATVEDTQLLRTSEKADLSRQNESSTFTTEQRYTSKFDLRQGAVGYAPVKDMPSGQVQLSQEIRVRGGIRDDANDKLYSNSKIREAQEIHRGTVKLTVALEGGGYGVTEVKGDISTEYSVKARAEAPATDARPPLPRNELGAASVVSFKNEQGTPGGDRLFRDVRQALEDRFQWRGGISDSLEHTLRSELGATAMQARLSQLTRGGVLKVPVAGPGWSAEVVVRAVLASEPVVKYTVKDGEFEVGTQNRTGHGVMRDIRDRVTGLLGLTGRVQKEQGGSPGVTLTGDYSYRRESSTGGNLQSSGTAVNRAKNVSDAVVSDVDVEYRVEIRGWTGGLIPSTTRLGPITMAAEVVTPKYADLTPENRRTVPDRVWQDHVLGSSDVVTNVYTPGNRDVGTAATDFGKAVLRGSGDPGEFGGRNVDKWLHKLGRSGLRHKLYEALGPDNLHDQLKTMMSGRQLVVSDGGVTIRIGASVKRLEHTGNTTTTEFNTGTQVEHGHSAADGVTGGGTGSNHQARIGVAVSTGMFYAGDTLAVSSGNNTRETWSNRAGSGNTTKVKPMGNVFTGEANLHFSVEWKEPLSTEGRHVMVTKRAYFRRDLGMDVVMDVAETRENVPGRPASDGDKTFTAATAPRGADLLRALTDDQPVTDDPASPPRPPAQIPPARVWTHGLVDTDVVRAVGMSPHAREQLTDGAEAFLGSGNWDRVQGLVHRMIDPVALASRLVTPHTPHTPATPATPDTPNPGPGANPRPPGRDEPTITDGPGGSTLVVGRTDLAGDVRVEVRMKVKELEYITTDTRSESNPTNATSVTDGVRAQRAFRVANRVTGGAVSPDMLGVATLRGGLYLDTAYEHRTDIETVEGGQVVNNAKIGTTTARYRGFVEVEVVYHKDGKTLPRKELMAIEIDIPTSDTTPTAVPRNAFLRFNDETRDGELRLHNAPKSALETVARALNLDVGNRPDHERLLRVGHVARKLLPEALTASGTRAERWTQGLDRMIALAADGAEGAPFDRLRGVMERQPVPPVERRRLQDLVEQAGTDTGLTAVDLTARWDVLTERQMAEERQQRMRTRLEAGGGQPDGEPLLPPSERHPDLSLNPRTAPDVRLHVVAGDERSMTGLLRRFTSDVLQEDVLRGRAPRAEGDDRRPVVEVSLDVPAGQALREARALELRLRRLAEGMRHEVDVVIVAGSTRVPRADRVAVGDAGGAVSSFRIGNRPPDTEGNTTVRRDPVNDGRVHDVNVAQDLGQNRNLNDDVDLSQDLNQNRNLNDDVDLSQDQNQDQNQNLSTEPIELPGRPVLNVEPGRRASTEDLGDNTAGDTVSPPFRPEFPRPSPTGPAGTFRRPARDEREVSSSSSRGDSSGEEHLDLPEDVAGPLNQEAPEQVRHLGQLPPVPRGRRADHVSDASLSSRSSVHTESSDDSVVVTAMPSQADTTTVGRHEDTRLGDEPDEVSDDSDLLDLPDAGHGRDGTAATWRTARLYEGEEDLYQHPGRRLGDDSDNVSVDSDLLDLPDPGHGRDGTATTWHTARLYEGEEDLYQHPGTRLGDDSDNESVDSDLTDSTSGLSDDSWVEVQPPPPPLEAGGPPRIPVPEPLPPLEDSIFAVLTQLNGDGGAGE
ncbi:hypothetical protein [Kitasatospora putterlickiae]|uniref:hypothetical protein n=1 Tax=Kitasatospora putterlickiae TaxID=221725 RepID=UPI0031CF9F12